MPTNTKLMSPSSEANNNNCNEKSNSNSNCDDANSFPSSRSTYGGQQNRKRGSTASNSSSSNSEDSRQIISSTDYDQIRDKTLMFFLDRLYIASKDGKQTRSLQELSCLFGTKEFTKEMRQIVGASRNGLRKFLQLFPSLFTIEGDEVSLTSIKQDSLSTGRDYNQEAVKYFTQKLEQFGVSLVPIKNLFGYRSQATREVRHVSGKNSQEFKQFLQNYPKVFELTDDEHVILKKVVEELESRCESLSSIQRPIGPSTTSEPIADPYLNRRFADYVESFLKQISNAAVNEADTSLNGDDNGNKGITVFKLHEEILKDCTNPSLLNIVRTVDDLRMFLRMHPKIFKRFTDEKDNSDYVRLFTDEEKRDLEAQALTTQTLLNEYRSKTFKRSETAESNLSDQSGNQSSNQPHSLPPISTKSSAQEQPSGKINRLASKKLQEKPDTSSCGGQEVIASDRDLSAKSQRESNLRATAPPFVPSNSQLRSLQFNNSYGAQQFPNKRISLCSAETPRAVPRSSSSLNQSSVTSFRQQQDCRANKRSYLVDGNSNKAPIYGGYVQNKAQDGSTRVFHTLQRHNSSMNQEDLRARTVDIVREASNITSRIMNSAGAVAFDCKGYNLGFNGQITLIQFAFLPRDNDLSGKSDKRIGTIQNKRRIKPEVCLFDLITNPELAYCLKPLLETDQVIKIVHDVRNKSSALFAQFGIMLNHVFDTQVANLVIQQQETGVPAYKSRYISMSSLCETYGDESLIKYRNLIQSKTRHSNQSKGQASRTKDANFWRMRPLTDSMVYESTMDVYCLIGGVYQNLKSLIKPEYEPLFKQLNDEGVLARIKPEEIRMVKKERKIDLEVIELKRKLYSDTMNPIVLSNREIKLLRHIDLSHEVRQKIQQCKKVAKKIERLDMKASLNARLLQSANGELSTEDGGDQLNNEDLTNSISQTNGSSSLSSYLSSSMPVGQDQIGDNIVDGLEIDNLMDSSMFDELKDKMIESSSLLKSLEDEDDQDDKEQQTDSSNKTLSRIETTCQATEADHEEECNSNRGTKSSSSDQHDSKNKYQSIESIEKGDSNAENRAVDMAIQCDLLSS